MTSTGGRRGKLEGVNKALLPEFRLAPSDVERLGALLDETLVLRSHLRPSQWYESKMVMPASDTYPGPVRYDRTPYWAEPCDCFDPNHPALDITIVGPAQMGKSVMVLNAVIAYVIGQSPVNILFLTGHTDLSKDAMEKIDYVIKCCDLEALITPNVLKKRHSRTGDTADKKEFRGVSLKAGSITNHNLLRQNTARITLADDLDAGKLSKEETGSTISLIKGRVRSSEDRSKRGWISTPQVKGRSLIEVQWDKSDKRFWFVQCPHCGNSEKRIRLEWNVKMGEKDEAGIVWKLDALGRVDPKTVGYVCQLCGEFFTDRDKHALLNSGVWQPTQDWVEPYHYGYSVNGLYAPLGMTSWYHLAVRYHACNPPGAPRVDREYQTWQNIDYGWWYEEETEIPSGTELMKNRREYLRGKVPESVSEADGNGDIIALFLAADCNGKLNDARIDWSLYAISRSGPQYLVDYGSCGTFIPHQNALEKERTRRELWTYEKGRSNSVWTPFDALLGKIWETDTGRRMKIFMTGVDAKYLSENVWSYIDYCQHPIIGLMGDKEEEYVVHTPHLAIFKKSPSRNNLFMINVNMAKDNLANVMRLPWKKNTGENQPHQYLNFPADAQFDDFFSHFESESKRENEKGRFLWQKKGLTSQNHQFDCKIYTDAIQAIFLWLGFHKINKDGSWTWADYAKMIPQRKK